MLKRSFDRLVMALRRSELRHVVLRASLQSRKHESRKVEV